MKNPNYLWQQPLPVFGWGSYGGSLKRAITVMKYENHPEIGRVLGNCLGVAWLLNTPQLNKKHLNCTHTTPHQKTQRMR